MNPSPELVSEFSDSLESWQSLYKEAILILRQKKRELALSKGLVQSTLQNIQLLEAKREQLQQQLVDLEHSLGDQSSLPEN